MSPATANLEEVRQLTALAIAYSIFLQTKCVCACVVTQTINTLRYAWRAKMIKNSAVVNMDEHSLRVMLMKRRSVVMVVVAMCASLPAHTRTHASATTTSKQRSDSHARAREGALRWRLQLLRRGALALSVVLNKF